MLTSALNPQNFKRRLDKGWRSHAHGWRALTERAPLNAVARGHVRADLQQPLELNGLLRQRSSGSYTGSNVLSMLVECRGSLASASLSGFWLPRSRASPLASRSQSFAAGHVQPNALSGTAATFPELHSSGNGSGKSGTGRSRSLGKSRSLSHAPAPAAPSLALGPVMASQGMAGEAAPQSAAALA